MPRIVSFLLFWGFIGALFYGGMYVVAEYLEPEPSKMEHMIGRIKVQR